MTKWVEDAFRNAMTVRGNEARTFLENIEKILRSYELSAGEEAFDRVLDILTHSGEMRTFVGLCFGAGMIEARKQMLQKSAE